MNVHIGKPCSDPPPSPARCQKHTMIRKREKQGFKGMCIQNDSAPEEHRPRSTQSLQYLLLTYMPRIQVKGLWLRVWGKTYTDLSPTVSQPTSWAQLWPLVRCHASPTHHPLASVKTHTQPRLFKPEGNLGKSPLYSVHRQQVRQPHLVCRRATCQHSACSQMPIFDLWHCVMRTHASQHNSWELVKETFTISSRVTSTVIIHF